MITITGNIGREPELRFTQSGTAVANFSVAVTRKRGNDEETSWFNVVCFKEQAENASECLVKGQRVIVVGKMQQRNWETDAGEKRSTMELVADEIGPSIRWATVTVERNERREPAAHDPESDPF